MRDDKILTSYIGGQWADSGGTDVIHVINPATEEPVAEVAMATSADADAAVHEAQRAFAVWASTAAAERADLLNRVIAEMRRREDSLTDTIVTEVGMPRVPARQTQVRAAISAFQDAVDFMPAALAEEEIGNTVVVGEPAGVVVGITPWNFPLYQIALKVAPALAAGCTVVLKPSEVTPLSALALAEIFDAVGAPAGVFNVVVGRGQDVGAALVANPGVDMISFTGSTRAGRQIAAAAAARPIPVALELGGKSPLVILDDVDLEEAVSYGVSRCFINSGQTCAALTRMLVPQDEMRRATELAVQAAARYVVGDPTDDGSSLGPLVSSAQRERVRGLIRSGIADGAELACGGEDVPDGLGTGWYVRPTVFSNVTRDMRIAREEIFGPVLVIMGYDGDADAVELANATDYGLAAGVYGKDPARTLEIARHIRSGCVFLGDAKPNPQAPFGGVKQSGYGRERGIHGIKEYLRPKSLIGARSAHENGAVA